MQYKIKFNEPKEVTIRAKNQKEALKKARQENKTCKNFTATLAPRTLVTTPGDYANEFGDPYIKGEAYIEIDDFQNKRWYNVQNQLHREDGPAVELADGNKQWYFHGRLHREDGPAIERANGDKEWWLNGYEFKSEEQWRQVIASRNKPVIAYHFTPLDGSLRRHCVTKSGKTVRTAEVGVTLFEKDIKLCEKGLHASRRIVDALGYAPGNLLHQVKCDGKKEDANDKLVCQKRTVLWTLDLTPIIKKVMGCEGVYLDYAGNAIQSNFRYMNETSKVKIEAEIQAEIAKLQIPAPKKKSSKKAKKGNNQ